MNKEKNSKYAITDKALVVYVIFSVVISLICAFVFLYDYRHVYDNDSGAGYLPPSLGMKVYYFYISIIFIIVSHIITKCIKNKTYLSILITLSIIIPIICYNINYHSFKKDGLLYSMVDEGGILQFLRIRDLNFDGVDDHLNYDGDDIREISDYSYGSSNNEYEFIRNCKTTAVGKGGNLSIYTSYGDGDLRLKIRKSRATYEYIKVTFTLFDNVNIEKISVFLYDTALDITVESENTISILFDSDICSEWQKNSLEETIVIPITISVER